MSSLTEMPAETVRKLKGVFFDIDDTFTSSGKILPAAFKALWNLKESGLMVVPVTGRPAGWCDHIARMWPVDAVVGENGAFYFWYDTLENRLKRRFLDSLEIRKANRCRLDRLKEEILSMVPGAATASDQAYREVDLAIDYCEDVIPLDSTSVETICSIFKRHGAECKVSSIHVNGWFGRYDKLAMISIFLRERMGLEFALCRDNFVFCGDSPNDEPLFEAFPCSVGVRNVLRFTGCMQRLPTYITNEESGKGFAELAALLLKLRKQ
ncbi:MAG TPA: HAD-IIB family hydrolase [Desulfobacteraceae bacterium]|nr:HAD-IIB family hydrolase [Desulfobacteraceae bacterium]